jgi:hypothetical protein
MRRDDEVRLNTAVDAVKAGEPDAAQVDESARRVASRLDIEFDVRAIEGCGDIAELLPSYRAGTLPAARTLLIEAHLRECSACRNRFRNASRPVIVNWSAPAVEPAPVWRPQQFGWAMAASFVLIACTFFLYKAYWQVPQGVRAEVQSIDGSAWRVSKAGDRQLSPGDQLTEGELLRTSGGAHAVLRLSDGSTVEMNERSVLGVGARGRSMTVTLDNGAVIVQAAKREFGHLYVNTPDCRVAVTGTVFSVSSGIKGSRVAVLQGSVHVAHAGIDTLMQAGDQLSTSDNLAPAPVDQQISWSHDRAKYLPLIAEFAVLQHRIAQIPFPEPRYSSDLLARVPAGTLLYISIPNLGEFLNEANSIFHDQLSKSPAMQQWWTRGHDNTAELDALVGKIHQMSQYLGEEIVIVGVNQPGNPGFAVIADVKQSGLDNFLNNQFPSSSSTQGLTVFDESSLNAAPVSTPVKGAGYALIRQNEAVFSNSIALLKQVEAQLNAGASGFAAGDFGQQITAAYGRGAGIILAADLHQMMARGTGSQSANGQGAKLLANSGMEDLSYLIAEHRELNGQPENHLNLQFAGTRQRVASWLAAPASMASLNFVTPNAAVVVAVLSKEPKDIADDILSMTEPGNGAQEERLSEVETKLNVNFRDDLAANLGGEFLLSLDGPVLPTPSWKAVIEVHDSAKLEQTLETLTASIRNLTQGKGSHQIAIQSSEAGGQLFYSVNDLTSGATVAQYTFSNGYMIVAPSRALLMQALETYASGDSLAQSAAFKALLPKDDNDNYSAVAYQNLSPVLSPLLSNFSGETAQALNQLAADAKPTAICAWGKDSRIEVASDSRLFGFDLLTLGTLMNSGNKHGNTSVKQ